MVVDAAGNTRISNTIAASAWSPANPVGSAVVDLTGTAEGGFLALLATGEIRRSIDQGTTWTDVGTPGEEEPLTGMVALDANGSSANGVNVVVVTATGTGSVSDDGGSTWTDFTVPLGLGLGTVVDVAWDGDVGIGFGGILVVDVSGGVVRSTDAGLNWVRVPPVDVGDPPATLGLTPVALDRAREYYMAVAADGSAVLYDPVADNGPDPLTAVPLVNVVDIAATGGLRGRRYLVVAADGTAAITVDDGTSWSAVATIT
jgi:photosystem II stability/assembly factor-like uncharacterized protein